MDKPEQKNIKDMTGEEIALALQARYQAIMQCQEEVRQLNAEIKQRAEPKEKD